MLRGGNQICEGGITTDTKNTNSMSLFPEVGATAVSKLKVVSFGTTVDKDVTIENIFFE